MRDTVLLMNRIFEVTHPFLFLVGNMILCAAFLRMTSSQQYRRSAAVLAAAFALLIPANLCIAFITLSGVEPVRSIARAYGQYILIFEMTVNGIALFLLIVGGALLFKAGKNTSFPTNSE